MDEFYMNIAIDCAKNGIGYVQAEPLMGIVIVKDNTVIGKDYYENTDKTNIIEKVVLNNNISDSELSKSTIYITYPNFSMDSIIYIKNKNISRTVFGTLKPHVVLMSSKVAKLCELGIQVKVGVLEKECSNLNEIYNNLIINNRPFIHVKWCMTLDGKAASYIGNNEKITSEKCYSYSQELRSKYSAIMVGINTILKNNPTLVCKYPRGNNPYRIIVDSNLRIEMDCKVLEDAHNTPTYIAITSNFDKVKGKILKTRGIKLIICKDLNGKVDLLDLMFKLSELNIDSVLLEGGGNLIFSALNCKIVDKVSVFIGAKIIGGNRALTPVTGTGFDFIKNGLELKNLTMRQFGTDILIEGYMDN